MEVECFRVGQMHKLISVIYERIKTKWNPDLLHGLVQAIKVVFLLRRGLGGGVGMFFSLPHVLQVKVFRAECRSSCWLLPGKGNWLDSWWHQCLGSSPLGLVLSQWQCCVHLLSRALPGLGGGLCKGAQSSVQTCSLIFTPFHEWT